MISQAIRAYLVRRNKAARVKHGNKKCLFCSRLISFEQRRNDFCNHSCAASFYNPQRKGRKGRWYCIDCGSNVPTRRHRRCQECRIKRRSLFFAKSDSFRKRLLIETRGHRCEGCLKQTWRKQPIPLELDHINGNSDNNSELNLRLLCPNCHAQTPTHKGRNKGRAGSRGQRRSEKRRAKRAALIGIEPIRQK